MESNGEQKLDQYYYDIFFPPKDPRENSTAMNFYYRVASFIVGGMTFAYSRNIVMLGRPLAAGAPLSIAAGLGIACAAEGVKRGMESYSDYENRRTFHYMTLHPELFPPPKRIKFADYFDEWETNR